MPLNTGQILFRPVQSRSEPSEHRDALSAPREHRWPSREDRHPTLRQRPGAEGRQQPLTSAATLRALPAPPSPRYLGTASGAGSTTRLRTAPASPPQRHFRSEAVPHRFPLRPGRRGAQAQEAVRCWVMWCGGLREALRVRLRGYPLKLRGPIAVWKGIPAAPGMLLRIGPLRQWAGLSQACSQPSEQLV